MTAARREEIARRLYEAREDLGLSQGELATDTGVIRSSISRYESGERVPSAKTMRKLGNALGKSVAYLRASDFREETNGTGRADQGSEDERAE